MKATYINYSDTNSFSPTILSYLAHDLKLKPFISYFPNIENFGKLIENKSSKTDRNVLVKALKSQYLTIPTSDKVSANINLLLQDNTFTVTTGHQLNIFTGPLYFIFKIVSAINLAGELKQAYPEKNFVPVYWMATEDHDFAEINHTSIYEKKISWNINTSGATGKIDPTSIIEALKAYQNTLGLSDNSKYLSAIIEQAYLHNSTLADATRYLVNALFSEYGLVILDADDPQLKKQFANVIEQDILHQNSFTAINDSSARLKESGFATQVNAREINFFYMIDNFRERIILNEGIYQVLNSTISFTAEELLLEIKQHPERFSPNVVMRPMYQEIILPNLAYIGGGAEIVYWLQLKKNFDFYQIDFPILLLRNSALVANEEFNIKLNHLHISCEELFKPLDQIKTDWVKNNSDHTLHLADEWVELSNVFEKLKQRAFDIDPTLSRSADAVKARLHHMIQNLEKKLIKADKRNHDEFLTQIETLKNAYFPGGGLQERSENFGRFYIKYGVDFIKSLIDHFKPLDGKFTIIEL